MVGEQLDLNRATLDDLVALPGIGEKTAAEIIGQREKAGGFASAKDILTVKGLGKARFSRLEKWISE